MREVAPKWWVCIGLSAVSAVVRLAYLAAVHPSFHSYYWDLSSAIRADGSLALDGARTTAFEPLYPLFLAAARFVARDHVVVVQALQGLVASAGALFLWRLAVTLTGRPRVAAIAASIFAVYPLLVRHAADPTESALLTTLLIAFAAAAASARTAVDGARAGAWLGLAALTRAMVLPLAVVVPLAIARRSRWAAVAMASAAIALYAPYALRNHRLSGAWLPTRGGINLYISMMPESERLLPAYTPDELCATAERRLAERGIGGGDSPEDEHREDAAYAQLALDEIRRHPWQALEARVLNLVYFFSPRLVPSHVPTERNGLIMQADGTIELQGSPARPAIDQIVYAATYVPLLAAALAGIVVRRRALGEDRVLWCMLAVFAATYAVFFPTTRYRVPVEFVLLFYAAVAVDWKLQMVSYSPSGRPASGTPAVSTHA